MYSSVQKRTINHIIQTTYNLLKQVEFSQLTIQMICNTAEINRSTFYRYFDDKYVLLRHIIDHIVSILYVDLQNTQQRSVFESLIYYVEENNKLFNHILADNRQVDLFSELVKISSQLLLEQSKKFDDQLSIKIRTAKHPKLLCDFYSSGIIEVLKQWMQNNYPYSKEELVEILNDSLI